MKVYRVKYVTSFSDSVYGDVRYERTYATRTAAEAAVVRLTARVVEQVETNKKWDEIAGHDTTAASRATADAAYPTHKDYEWAYAHSFSVEEEEVIEGCPQ